MAKYIKKLGPSKCEILRMYRVFKSFAAKVSNFKIVPRPRMPIFPEYISENIIMSILNKPRPVVKKLTRGGDLYSETEQKLECKCFTSRGPISFGPKETWNVLYILDGTEYLHRDSFKLYRVDMSNEEFGQILINSKDTYHEQCRSNKRPRITWNSLRPQIIKNCSLLFDDEIGNI